MMDVNIKSHEVGPTIGTVINKLEELGVELSIADEAELVGTLVDTLYSSKEISDRYHRKQLQKLKLWEKHQKLECSTDS